MLQLTPQSRIFLATQPVDFRKGIDGLTAVCRQVLRDNPLEGAVYVFRNRAGTALKLLLYDGQGYWLCLKRLSPGALYLVAYDCGRTGAPVRAGVAHCAVEWRSRAGPDGPRLAPRRLRRR